MAPPFVPVGDAAALEPLFAADAGPLVLFLHDPYCGSSARAYGALAGLPGPVYLLDVAALPHLCGPIAARTRVRHESPQALVLRDGRAVWSASHVGVTAEAVRQARHAAAGAAAGT